MLRTLSSRASSCLLTRGWLSGNARYNPVICRNLTSTPIIPEGSGFLSKNLVPVVFAASIGTGVATYFFFPDVSRSAPTSAKDPLSPSHFTPATVISTELSGPNTKLIKLAIPPQLLPSPKDPSSFSFSPIWSVCIKDDDIQVERAYTPLHGVDENGHMLFWIKKYPKGEVGRWLHSKNVGDQVELRGPLMTFLWRDNIWDEVVMISGGTGITPFFQLFHTLISNPSASSKTRFTLLHSSRSPEELPPPTILAPLTTTAATNPEKFKLHLFVDSPGTPSTSSPSQPLQVGRIGEDTLRHCLGLKETPCSWWQCFKKEEKPDVSQRRVLVLVCGPEPMINAIAGPFGRNFSQGPVGGILGNIGLSSSQVRKLS